MPSTQIFKQIPTADAAASALAIAGLQNSFIVTSSLATLLGSSILLLRVAR